MESLSLNHGKYGDNMESLSQTLPQGVILHQTQNME